MAKVPFHAEVDLGPALRWWSNLWRTIYVSPPEGAPRRLSPARARSSALSLFGPHLRLTGTLSRGARLRRARPSFRPAGRSPTLRAGRWQGLGRGVQAFQAPLLRPVQGAALGPSRGVRFAGFDERYFTGVFFPRRPVTSSGRSSREIWVPRIEEMRAGTASRRSCRRPRRNRYTPWRRCAPGTALAGSLCRAVDAHQKRCSGRSRGRFWTFGLSRSGCRPRGALVP